MKLLVDSGVEERIRNNFDTIEGEWNKHPLTNGSWQLIDREFVAKSYPATLVIPHKLGFIPKDVIQTQITGSGTIVYNYSSFTATTFSVTVSNAVAVRFLIGKM